MPAVRVPGGTLDYECHGEPHDPSLLLLHALGSSLAMWDLQIPRLARHFHVVRYSLRGHGAANIAGAQDLDIDALAGDACTVLDTLGIARAHWCGLSLGGMTAMRVARRFPERVDRLVLASTAAHMPPPESWVQRIALVRERGMAPLADATMERWFTPAFRQHDPDEVARIRRIFLATDPQGYAAACTAIRDMDQRADLPHIRAPTLVIAGARDTGIPPARAEELRAAIADARLTTLNAAHLSNIETRNDFTAAVLAHLGVT